ncbi:MAG: hypothetical protein LAT57_09630 [Balneolales bacterium]|nr:hypothetical protein [Balneolales bacterium]
MMFKRLKALFSGKSPSDGQAELRPELSKRILVEGHDKRFFEQALKFYIFSRHVSVPHISVSLAEQLTYSGHIVYSLLVNWLRDGRASIEYMDFLNTKLNELRALPEESLQGLEIKPNEINDIELTNRVRLQFTDDETSERCWLEYYPGTGECRFEIRTFE